MEMRKLFLAQELSRVELRATGEGADQKRTINGLAAVFYDGTERTEYVMKFSDGYVIRERIMPGAFADVLANDVRGLFNHDPNMLLGRTTAGTLALEIRADGLAYVINVPDTTVGNDVAENVRLKNLTGSSFAFRVAKDGQKWIDTDSESVREITKFSSLFDVGPVTYPAYEATETSLRDAVGIEEDCRTRREEAARSALATKKSIMDKRIRSMQIGQK